VYDGYFIDIGIPSTLQRAQDEVKRWRRKPAVFFDRDGVINEDTGYVHKGEAFHWKPGAVGAVKIANDNRYLVILVRTRPVLPGTIMASMIF
jgi:hypothetical protein